MSVYTDVSWMTVDDHDATTGNGYVTHTPAPYTGRVQRSGYTTITTVSTPSDSAIVSFVQLPQAEYVRFDNATYQAGHNGGTVTLTGKTNAPRLDFALVNDGDGIATLPQYFSITVGSQTTGNQAVSGQTFANDPGASGEFSFSITIQIAANATMSQRYCMVRATGSTGVTGTATILQAATTSYINLGDEHESEVTLTFGAEGSRGSVDVDVYSNDTWTIEVTED